MGTDLGSANGLAALGWKVRDAEPGALPPPATSLLATKRRKLSLPTLVGGFRGQSEGGEQQPYHVKFFWQVPVGWKDPSEGKKVYVPKSLRAQNANTCKVFWQNQKSCKLFSAPLKRGNRSGKVYVPKSLRGVPLAPEVGFGWALGLGLRARGPLPEPPS